jgi:hypothetical protein
MRTDIFRIETVAEVLGAVVFRHASARGNDGWLDMAADIHPADRRDAARDLLGMLEARGIGLRREVGSDSTGLGGRLMRLAVALAAASANPAQVQTIAGVLCDLAAEAQDRDDAMIPLHLRMVPGALPAGVVALDQRRRA